MRRGFVEVGVVAGQNASSAERRFYDQRPRRGGGVAAMSVAIVDYGSGNLRSAAKAFERAMRAKRR